MKKVLFAVLLVALSVISCTKQALSPNYTDTAETSKQFNFDDMQLKSAPWRSMYDNGDDDYGCAAPVGSCFPYDIVIEGLDEPVFVDILNAIETDDKEIIADEFDNHSSVLEHYFGATYINGVISGSHTVKPTGAIANGLVLFTFKEGSVVKITYPIEF